MKKSSKVILILLVVVVLLIIGIETFFIIKNQNDANQKIENLEKQIQNSNKIEISKDDKVGNNINEIKENADANSNKNYEENADTNNNENYEENNKDYYSKYFGAWKDYNNGESTLEVLNIGNNLFTFSWIQYRIARMDYVTIPMKNNKAVFYYQGYNDKNYNAKQDDGEHYYRKATIQLNNDNIVMRIENISDLEYDIELERDFIGSEYIDEATYVYKIK